jgi:8-amino-7-oxononanoate synthase
VLDFTSALYLGLRHPTWALRPWTQLSLGKPAALEPPPGADFVAGQLAALQGCEAATLGPSTFHLFWDLFDLLAKQNIAVFMDAETYPIARWGIEHARARGVWIQSFPHRSISALHQAARQCCPRRVRPVVVTDGFCSRCGQVAPLKEYLEVARDSGGWLVVDDTQAMGLLGERPSPAMPYGRGGGGSSRHTGAHGPEVLRVSSLAKGFGVPLAVLAGALRMVAEFERESKTRVHCSPPSIPEVRAAERVLNVNQRHGDSLRRRLWQLVSRFRSGLAKAGVACRGGCFPAQTPAAPGGDVLSMHRHLLQQGIRAVLQQPRAGGAPRLSFLITASHTPIEIDEAVAAIAAFHFRTQKEKQYAS